MNYSIDWDGPGEKDCACLHFDRCECANMRLHRQGQTRNPDEYDPCDCACHAEYEDEQDEEEWVPDHA